MTKDIIEKMTNKELLNKYSKIIQGKKLDQTLISIFEHEILRRMDK